MDINNVLKKVFAWMFVGLLITFVTGFIIASNENMVVNVFSGGAYLACVILDLGLVFILSLFIRKLSPMAAKIMFILYAFFNGVTFASIFIEFEVASIIFVFLATALVFGMFSLLGYRTNIDLSKIGIYLIMILIAGFICTIINLFLGNPEFDLVISVVMIILFMAFTVYDVYLIKENRLGIPEEDNLAIYGALQLYLDYINIFIRILSFFGDRK